MKSAQALPAGKPNGVSFTLLCLLLTCAVAVPYVQTASFDFLDYDDREYVTENAHVRAGITWDSLAWAFTTTEQANWHPLTWISLMLDAELGNLRPAPFHITNVLLHAANVLLLFAAFERLTRARLPSAFVAALLAVHPLHVESVAWVAERKDVLAAFFGFLALLAYARFVERPGAARSAWVAAALAASLLSKPTFVSLPLLLLLLDVWPLGRLRLDAHGARDALALVREKALLFALAGVSAVVTVFAQKSGGALASFDLYPLRIRIANALVSYVVYLGKAFLPTGLAVPYPHPRGELPLGSALLCGLLLVGISALVFLFARRRPYLAVGWLWYVVSLVPMIGIVQVGGQARADRYTYLPLVGISVIVAWGACDLAQRLVPAEPARRAVLSSGALLGLGVLTVLCRKQAAIWHDSVTLFDHVTRVTRANDIAENNLGSGYYALGMMEEAAVHYQAAVTIEPRYAVALNNLAGTLNKLGRTEEALARWNEAIAVKPDFSDARANLAGALYKAGRVEEAIHVCEVALRLDPTHGATHYNLGLILMRQGRLEEALPHFETAAAGTPGDTMSILNLGVVLAKLGRLPEAIRRFEEVLRLDPENDAARKNLERARAEQEGKR